MLQTSSNQRDSHRLSRASVTNVVNLRPKTLIFSEKAVGLTTFVTTDQKSTRKTPPIDDVCNNTQRSAPKSQHDKPDHIGGSENQAAVPVGGGEAWPGFETTHPATHEQRSAAGVEGAGGTGGPGCGAHGRRRGLAGLRADAPNHASATRPHRCEGRRRVRRARAGFETRHRAKRGCLVSRAAGHSGARNTRGATQQHHTRIQKRPPGTGWAYLSRLWESNPRPIHYE